MSTQTYGLLYSHNNLSLPSMTWTILSRSMWWSTVSNTALRSSRTNTNNLPVVFKWTSHMSSVSVLWLNQIKNCQSIHQSLRICSADWRQLFQWSCLWKEDLRSVHSCLIWSYLNCSFFRRGLTTAVFREFGKLPERVRHLPLLGDLLISCLTHF